MLFPCPPLPGGGLHSRWGRADMECGSELLGWERTEALTVMSVERVLVRGSSWSILMP